MVGRRMELGGGIAAAVLALCGLALLLFAPLLTYCAVAAQVCPASAVRHESLLEARLSAGAWVVILVPCLLALVGSAGACADVLSGWRRGRVVLGIAAGLNLLVCLVLTNIGLVYLPAMLALILAAYGALLARRADRDSPPAEASGTRGETPQP